MRILICDKKKSKSITLSGCPQVLPLFNFHKDSVKEKQLEWWEVVAGDWSQGQQNLDFVVNWEIPNLEI